MRSSILSELLSGTFRISDSFCGWIDNHIIDTDLGVKLALGVSRERHRVEGINNPEDN